jgi:putative transposase
MPRPGGRRKSLSIRGHAHGLTFTCYRRHRFLARDRTCAWLGEAIDDARRRLGFSLWAYVFMPEHVHLVVRPDDDLCHDLGRILQAIKAPVGRKAMAFLEREAPEWLGRVTRRRGRRVERLFWQSGGGYDRNVDDPVALARMIDYVHANPIRRGLVVRPWDWKWSSASSLLLGVDGPIRLDPVPAEWGV